jgi:hypothetical protein
MRQSLVDILDKIDQPSDCLSVYRCIEPALDAICRPQSSGELSLIGCLDINGAACTFSRRSAGILFCTCQRRATIAGFLESEMSDEELSTTNE